MYGRSLSPAGRAGPPARRIIGRGLGRAKLIGQRRLPGAWAATAQLKAGLAPSGEPGKQITPCAEAGPERQASPGAPSKALLKTVTGHPCLSRRPLLNRFFRLHRELSARGCECRAYAHKRPDMPDPHRQ